MKKGEETQILQEIDLTVDWYGGVTARINTNTETLYANESINRETQTIDLKYHITTEEINKQLILTENGTKGIIPNLHGYKPTKVALEGKNAEFTYDEETQEFNITRTGDNIAKTNTYTLLVSYPLEAYETAEEEITTLQTSVETYYIGKNNPKKQFENPVKSSIVSKVITIIIERERPTGGGKPIDFVTSIGKYVTTPNTRYVISKELPLKRYEGATIEENTEYSVQWKVIVNEDKFEGLELKQTKPDTIIENGTGAEISMEDYVRYTGIYITNATALLGDEGYINVIDADTNEIIHTFTVADWDKYTANSPYKYEETVKNIKVETSETTGSATFFINHIKEIDDVELISQYDEDEFNNLELILTYFTGRVNDEISKDKVAGAYYEGETSVVKMSISRNELSTQDTEENEIITIQAKEVGYNTAKWKNAEFLLKFPKDIAFIEINDIKTSSSAVEILGYELYKQDENYFVKIVTSNENETNYEISINCDMQADPRIQTAEENMELYAKNENCEYYKQGSNATDIYDINSNQNLEELVGYATVKLRLISPGLLTTAQIASEYDDFNSITLAPQVAEITPKAVVDSTKKEEQTAKVSVQIRNNYQGTVSEAKILGKIPFKGNTDEITGKDLGSTYTTKMKDTGIVIPENLVGKVTVYYSTNATPTNDLNDAGNRWTTKPSNWEEVKTFLIDFNDYIINKNEECVFEYEISIPNNVNYNQISYSLHKVNFCLDTENGRLPQEVEPRKLGFLVAEKYDLMLTKYKKATNQTLKGVTFKISELNENGEEVQSKIRNTDENGILNIEKLYVERTYELSEIKTLTEYDLNSEKIRFRTSINQETGNLEITILSGHFKDDKVDIIQLSEDNDLVRPIVNVALENEVKYNLCINKTDANTNMPIRGTRFTLADKEKTKMLISNGRGQINITGISIGKEYTLTETESKGYYLEKPIKFIVTRNDSGILELKVTHENGEQTTYNFEENIEGTVCPKLTLNIKNTPIPTYNFQITKIAKQIDIKTDADEAETTVKKLEGAQFELYSKDLGTKEIYTTDADGNISLQGLYEYVEGKEITGEYILKEIYPPVGHALNVAELTFRAQRDTNGNLILVALSGSDLIADTETEECFVYDEDGNEIPNKAAIIENANTQEAVVGITVEDDSIFSIEKIDEETGKVLEGAKFAIYELDENNESIGPAKDIDGNVLGKEETINGVKYNVLTTNVAGQITANLGEGYYKVVEVSAPEGYVLEPNEENRTYYFGIGRSKPAEKVVEEVYNKADFESNKSRTYKDVVATSDGGQVIIGEFAGTIVIPEDKTQDGEKITIVGAHTSQTDELAIKYNAEGKVEWAKRYGLMHNESSYEIIQNTENELVFIGARNITGTNYLVLNKIDMQTGELIYESSSIQLGNNNGPIINRIMQTKDNGYIVAGRYSNLMIPEDMTNNLGSITKTATAGNDGIIIKFNSDMKIEWYNTLGGATGTNNIQDIVELSNGELIGTVALTAGSCEIDGEEVEFSAGQKIVKFDANGNISKIINTSGLDEINRIVATEDGYSFIGRKGYAGDILVGGESDTFNAGIYIINADINDNIIWKYQSNTGYYSWINDFKRSNDGGYIFTARHWVSNKSPYISTIKVDSEGKEQWQKWIGGFKLGEIEGVDCKEDKFIVVCEFAGVATERGMIGATCLEYDAEGNIIWSDSISGLTQTYNATAVNGKGESVAVGTFKGLLKIEGSQIADGEGIELKSKGNESDALIVKYNEEGQILWEHTAGGTSTCSYRDVIAVQDGYIAVGEMTNPGTTTWHVNNITIPEEETEYGGRIVLNSRNSSDIIIFKYTENGKVEWAKIFGGTGTDVARAVTPTFDKGYMVAGDFTGTFTIPAEETANGSSITLTSLGSSDGVVIKFNENNLVEWATTLGGTNSGDNIYEIAEDNGQTALAMHVSNNGVVNLTTTKGETLKFECSSWGGDDILISLDENGDIIWALKIVSSYYRS